MTARQPGRRLVVALLLPGGALATEMDAIEVARLLALANGADAAARLAATRALFGQGAAALPALRQAGARPMATITPPRGDVIFTVLSGALPAGRVRPGWLGLHLAQGVTEAALRAMGERHGFARDPGMPFDAAASPTAYVRLEPGRAPLAVMRALLEQEPGLVTLNLVVAE